jgi:copper chaperone
MSEMRRNPVVPMHTIYNVYDVAGMTCEHCAASVTEELFELELVTDVAVNLTTGSVTVTSADELSRPHVAAALAQTGHRLAG